MTFILTSPSGRPEVTIARLFNTFRIVVLDTTPMLRDRILRSIREHSHYDVSPVSIDAKGEPRPVGRDASGTIHVLDATVLKNPESGIWPLRRFASSFGEALTPEIGAHDRLLVLTDGLATVVPHGIEGPSVAVVQIEGLGPDEYR